MKKKLTMFLGFAVLSGTANAQFSEQIVQRPDLGANAFLGRSVDIDGALAVIGSSGVSTMTGSAQLYEWSSTTERWEFSQELTYSGDLPGDAVGTDVAIQGERMVLGAPIATAGGHGLAGRALIFEESSAVPGTYTAHGVVYASDAESGAQFGHVVAIHGDWVMVGAPEFEWNSALNSYGKVYCYERKSGALHWGPTQDVAIRPLSGPVGERFGYSLDMDDTWAIIGVPLGGSSAGGTGEACIYSRAGGLWTEEDTLSPSEDAGGFGHAVAVDGDHAVVGAPYDDSDDGAYANSGAAYVFRRSGSDWSQVAKLTASDESSSLFFGVAVAIEGNRVIVGTDEEAVYVFSRRNLGSGMEWFQSAKIEASDGSTGDEYGMAVAIDEDRFVVGARLADAGAVSQAGKAYFYHYDGNFASYCFADKEDCPCGNDDPLAGCANSTGEGALIAAHGSSSVFAMDLKVRITDVPGEKACLLFATQNALRAPFANTDGLRCAGGGLVRLGVKFSSTSGVVLYGAHSTIGKTGVVAGDVRYFQCWYRDEYGPCGNQSNTSNGLRIRFGT